MNAKEISMKIRKEADELLQAKQIEARLQQIGEVYFSGSYYLDLMIWRDLDLQVVLHPWIDRGKAFDRLQEQWSQDPDFIELKQIAFRGDYRPEMPRGLYLKAVVCVPRFESIWKLDIWSLESEAFHQNRTFLKELESRLDTQKRELILGWKKKLSEKDGKMPHLGSHFLYQAILLEGLQNEQAILEYIHRNSR
jgi:hypothetical protein